MSAERRVVDNRVFLLGLDELYREAMKPRERDELLSCARETAAALAVGPADVPIEGYYAEDERLTEYFRLMRSLQKEPKDREIEVVDVIGFSRLKQVTQSPIFGPPFDDGRLLSAGMDALSLALTETFPEWNVERLTLAAYECALNSDDFSLVALASLARDPVVLAALRESVVLYAVVVGGGAFNAEPEYVWQVDEIVESRARQFVAAFNDLFGKSLPEPAPGNAEVFWNACNEWKIAGRCVRIGFDDGVSPIRHYHWAVDYGSDFRLIVKDFWDTEIWTTERYREKTGSRL